MAGFHPKIAGLGPDWAPFRRQPCRHRRDAERLLGDIETASESPMLDRVRESRLACETWDIAFSCDGLVKRDALVVRLMPDQASAARFAELLAARDELSNEFLQKFGVAPGRPYVPHVSIGYFADAHGAERAAGHFAAWNEVVRRNLKTVSLRLSTISLYGFSDMARFFRLPMSVVREGV